MNYKGSKLVRVGLGVVVFVLMFSFSYFVTDTATQNFSLKDYSESQLAKALPFGNVCYNFPFFICGDYAYEYCQIPENGGVEGCMQLGVAVDGTGFGHAINIRREGRTYTIIEPSQLTKKGTEFKIATFKVDPKTDKKIVNALNNDDKSVLANFGRFIPKGDHNLLLEKFMIGSSKRNRENSRFFVSPATVRIYDFYEGISWPDESKLKNVGYWSEGWHRSDQMVKLTNQMRSKGYAVPRLPLCAALDQQPCDLMPVVPITTKTNDYVIALSESFSASESSLTPYSLVPLYQAMACRSSNDLPHSAVCKDGKITITNKPVDIPVKAILTASESESTTGKITLTLNLEPAYLYGEAAGNKEYKATFSVPQASQSFTVKGKTLPLKTEIDAGEMKKLAQANGFKNHELGVYAILGEFRSDELNIDKYTKSNSVQSKDDPTKDADGKAVNQNKIIGYIIDRRTSTSTSKCIEVSKTPIVYESSKIDVLQRKKVLTAPGKESSSCPDVFQLTDRASFSGTPHVVRVEPFTTTYSSNNSNNTYTLEGNATGAKIIVDPKNNKPDQTSFEAECGKWTDKKYPFGYFTANNQLPTICKMRKITDDGNFGYGKYRYYGCVSGSSVQIGNECMADCADAPANYLLKKRTITKDSVNSCQLLYVELE